VILACAGSAPIFLTRMALCALFLWGAEATPLLAMSTPESAAAPPKPPFSDYRYEAPGNVRKITLSDLPEPYATSSAANQARLVPRPPGLLPQAPAGFHVNLFAEDLNGPRVIRAAPNGDMFLAESAAGQIRVYRGITADGRPKSSSIFVTHLNRPYGIAFYPRGPHPQWLYIGDTDAVVRVPYQVGDLEGSGRTRGRFARRQGALDSGHCVLARQPDDVRRRGIGIERRRS
jgi:glucose/arabinose dehydrogenase